MRRITILALAAASLLAARPCRAQLSPSEAAVAMGRGINLGNTLEPPLEGAWNNPPAEEHYFDDYAAAGFSTVRIPVRWDEHTQEQSPFAVDEAWMDRVEQVVGWALERDLFVIVNAHHDDWVKADYDDPLVRARLDSIWSQVATRFADAPDRLLFEMLNEPFGMSVAQVDEMNERVLEIIRRTNPSRIVVYSGNEWSGPGQLMAAAVPDDSYLMGYYHSYDPWEFAGLGNGTWGSAADRQAVRDREETMRAWSDEAGVPVMHSEFGAVRSTDYNSRMRFYAAYVESMVESGIPFQVWDDGGNFGIYERGARAWDDDVLDILINAYPDGPTDLSLDVEDDSVVTVTWRNRSEAFARLVVERASGDGVFEPIAELDAASSSFEDLLVEGGRMYRYRVIAVDALRGDRYSYPVRIEVPATRSGFGGAPAIVPGVIEAENFDRGGEGVAYHDVDAVNSGGAWRPETGVDIEAVGGGYHVVEVAAGEWLEYSIDVVQSGRHRVRVFVAAETDGGLFVISAGSASSGRLHVPATGGVDVTLPIESEFDLPAGRTTLRFAAIVSGDYSIDRFEIDLISGTNREDAAEPATPEFYPNPVTDEIVVRLGAVGRDATATIFDSIGRVVLSAPVGTGLNRLSVDALPPGAYVIRINTDGRQGLAVPVVVL